MNARTRTRTRIVRLWSEVLDGLTVVGATAVVVVLLAWTACGCALADFTVAGLGPDELDAGALEDVEGSETAVVVDGVTVPHDAAPGDAPPAVDGAAVETRTPDAAPDTDRPPQDTAAPDTAAPDDGGCPLHDHYDPTHGAHYLSCMPSGVVGRPETYSSALLADEVARAQVGSPFVWGKATSACDGECTAYALPVDGGTNWQVWCTGGTRAGWYAGALGAAPMCPSADVHGAWW